MNKLRIFILIMIMLPVAILAQSQKPVRMVFISSSNEYVSHQTLTEYKKYLESKHDNVQVTILQGTGEVNAKDEFTELPGTDALKECDVLLVFARRTGFSGKAMEDIKRYVQAGGAVVGIRTASHAFNEWPEFDKDILGGSYRGHYFGEPEKRELDAQGVRYVVGEPTGEEQVVTIHKKNRKHPVLKGVSNFRSKYSLYQTAPVSADSKILLTGKTAEGTEPVAWTRTTPQGSKVVYIALGGVQDWQNNNFKTFVTNALMWASKK